MPTDIEKMTFRKQKLEKELQKTQKNIAKLPEGKLCCVHDETRYKWFVSKGEKYNYLPKRERKLAEKLVYKRYLICKEKEYSLEIKAIEAYLNHLKSFKEESQELLIDPGYLELLSPYIKPKSQELYEWASATYEKNENYPEGLIHKIPGGVVRSKSESMIAMALQNARIPYRYECALYLEEGVFYPDFTIRHPVTGEEFLWEHLGLMDQEEYINHAFRKLAIYARHGIRIEKSLIITQETKEDPLDYEQITEKIERYFR